MRSRRPVVTRVAPSTEVLSSLSSLDPVHARLYAMRGVTAPAELDYDLANLAPVSSLENVDAAVALLREKRDEKIVIVGDFDVDGATSTALFMRCLQDFHYADVEYLVPNRFDYGYGLTPEIVAVAAEKRPGLIVTVDNGISSNAGVAAASEAGIPVLITDHHLPGENIPDAAVIVNPNLPGSGFPSRHLAGVGVAFYVIAALARALEQDGFPGAARIPARYLDLVALGTVADVVPLDHNNRVLVEQGIRRIRAGKTVAGIRALLDQSGCDARCIVSTDLGFAVGPRLNAAGRLDDMSLGIECLLTDDPAKAVRDAEVLDAINRERRDIEADMRDQAFAFVDSFGSNDLPACVCVFEESWHQGIVGLVAARVKERCHRPVIAFARESAGVLKGSARSVPGVHARDLLESVSCTKPGLIEKFGGHAMAAGLTMLESHFDEFAQTVSARLEGLYPDADFSGAIVTDGPLPSQSLNLGFARSLRDAGPWGAGFPEPLWCGDFNVIERRTVGDNHVKMKVRPVGGGPPIDAIAFNQAGPAYRGVVQLAYRLDVNEYRGVESPQLVVEQIAALESARAVQ